MAEGTKGTFLSFEQSKPWRGVGRINIAGYKRRGMCTGTLIAPDIVLTAAHCVIDHRSGRRFPPGNIFFVAGWHKGKATGHSKAQAVAVHPEWKSGKPQKREDLGADLALVRLAKPISAKAATPFPIGRPDLPGSQIQLLSYRRDRAHALTHQTACRYRAMLENVMTFLCDIAKGSSGGPVFRMIDGTPHVIGVISARSKESPPRGFAARADVAIDRLRDLLP